MPPASVGDLPGQLAGNSNNASADYNGDGISLRDEEKRDIIYAKYLSIQNGLSSLTRRLKAEQLKHGLREEAQILQNNLCIHDLSVGVLTTKPSIVRRIPVEILCEIFILYVKRGGNPIRIMEVCRVWHGITRRTPCLWARIGIGKPRDQGGSGPPIFCPDALSLKSQLALVGTHVPLSIYFFNLYRTDERAFSLLAPFTSRIRKIIVLNPQMSSYESRSFLQFFERPFATLEELEWDLPMASKPIRNLLKQPIESLLTLKCAVIVHPMACFHLQVLQLGPRVTAIHVHSLAPFPHLHTLTLQYISQLEGDKVELPSLKRLTLMGMDNHWFSIARTPMLEVLVISGTRKPPPIIAIEFEIPKLKRLEYCLHPDCTVYFPPLSNRQLEWLEINSMSKHFLSHGNPVAKNFRSAPILPKVENLVITLKASPMLLVGLFKEALNATAIHIHIHGPLHVSLPRSFTTTVNNKFKLCPDLRHLRFVIHDALHSDVEPFRPRLESMVRARRTSEKEFRCSWVFKDTTIEIE